MPRGGRHTRPDSIPDGFLAQFLAPFAWQRLVKAGQETTCAERDGCPDLAMPGPHPTRTQPLPDIAHPDLAPQGQRPAASRCFSWG